VSLIPNATLTWLRDRNWIAWESEDDVIPLTGGVSSSVWRIDGPKGRVCVKQSLSQLKVARQWLVSKTRTQYEFRWLQYAGHCVQDFVPKVLDYDSSTQTLVLEYLPSDTHTLWKPQLLSGRSAAGVAKSLGQHLGRLHRIAASDPVVASDFDSADLFEALRLAPYFRALEEPYPELKASLSALIHSLEKQRRTLIHGDVSPKNIFAGPKGAVLLDAECATLGDPAFDVAMLLSHLFLKCAYCPQQISVYCDEAKAFWQSYAHEVDWEPQAAIERRVCALIPAFMLARLDGKSPVEYLSGAVKSTIVRPWAIKGVLAPESQFLTTLSRWESWVQ
jgi:5-methylthioribose kinase